MTIAIGILVNHGLVMAADTQMTYGSGQKGSEGKLLAYSKTAERGDPMNAFAVTGSTDRVPYLRAMQHQLHKDFVDAGNIDDPAEVEGRFGNVVEDFATRHIAPYSDHPSLDLIVGFDAGFGKTAMWSTHRGAMRRHVKYAVVGYGQPYATTLLDRLWRPMHYDVASGVALAVFVAHAVKDSVDGCGKYTDVCYLSGGERHWIDSEVVDRIERLSEHYLDASEPDHVRRSLFGVDLPIRVTGQHIKQPRRMEDLRAAMAVEIDKIRSDSPRVRFTRQRDARNAQATSPDPPPPTESS